MSDVLQDFLEFFNLDALLNASNEITVAQFLGLEICCFIAALFTIIGVRCVMEFIKILTDYKRFS